MNFTTAYNPYKNLKQSLKEDGLPAYTPYIKDGYVQITENGRIVMVPEVHLDANAYRDWFKKEFPEGRTEIIRHTEPPYMLPDGNLKYPQEIFEAKLYKNSEDTLPAANGWGKAAYKDNAEFDEIGTAISKAFKNAMRNMGFGVDFDTEKVQESLPKYVELSTPGKLTEVAPLDNRILMKDEYAANSTQNTVTDVSCAPSQNTPAAPVEMPVFPETLEPNPIPEVVNSSENVLAYLDRKAAEADEAELSEAIDVELPSEEAAIPADEVLAAPSEPEEAIVEVENAESFSTREILFQTLQETDPLASYNGKTLGELYDASKNILAFIVKPTFKWQQRIPENVYTAIVELMK